MALGADKINIVQLVVRGAFQKVAVGLILGVPLAIGAGRLISALPGRELGPLVAFPGHYCARISAFVAAVIPAARASGIEPIRALLME